MVLNVHATRKSLLTSPGFEASEIGYNLYMYYHTSLSTIINVYVYRSVTNAELQGIAATSMYDWQVPLLFTWQNHFSYSNGKVRLLVIVIKIRRWSVIRHPSIRNLYIHRQENEDDINLPRQRSRTHELFSVLMTMFIWFVMCRCASEQDMRDVDFTSSGQPKCIDVIH